MGIFDTAFLEKKCSPRCCGAFWYRSVLRAAAQQGEIQQNPTKTNISRHVKTFLSHFKNCTWMCIKEMAKPAFSRDKFVCAGQVFEPGIGWESACVPGLKNLEPRCVPLKTRVRLKFVSQIY